MLFRSLNLVFNRVLFCYTSKVTAFSSGIVDLNKTDPTSLEGCFSQFRSSPLALDKTHCGIKSSFLYVHYSDSLSGLRGGLSLLVLAKSCLDCYKYICSACVTNDRRSDPHVTSIDYSSLKRN